MKNVISGVYTKGENSYDFDFYTDLSYSDKLSFVNSVVDILVDGEYYNSIIRDLIFDFYIIDIFTNIDTSDLVESASFVDDVEEFLEDTDIVDIVSANVDEKVLSELNKAIDKSIEYRTGIHENQLGDAIANLMNTINNKISNIDLNGMSDIASMFAGMADGFTTENIVNAYLNSDFHKKNLEEIEESKKNNIEIVKNIEKELSNK